MHCCLSPKAEKISMPKVFLHPSLNDGVKKHLQEVAEKMHCTVVTKKTNATIVLLTPVTLSTEGALVLLCAVCRVS